MKKIFIPLTAAAMLLGTPATQAAFVSHPVEVVAGATAANTTAAPSTAAATESGSVAVTKTIKAKKLSFFAKMKGMLRGFGSGKSQITAAILAFFLGSLGVHRFYLGYTWQGIAQLLLTGGGLGIYIAGIASAVAAVAGGTVAIPTLAIVGMVMLFAGSIWVTVDFIRILLGNLEPKDGGYDRTF